MIEKPNYGSWRLTECELVRAFVFLFVPLIASESDVESWFSQFPAYDLDALRIILDIHFSDKVVKAWRWEFAGTLDLILSAN